MDIKLNFINQSNDANNSRIVIFSQNVAASPAELAVAWLVIQNCAQGDNHPFTYPMQSSVSAGDSYGNYTRQLAAMPGQLFHMIRSTSGDTLAAAGNASSSTAIEVRNDLARGAINAGIYKNSQLYATKTNIAPGQTAVFQFKPTIWIGAVSQVEQGQVMNSAIVSSINTEISLLGISSADIVMTGGGPGPNSTPFTFTLANVVMS